MKQLVLLFILIATSSLAQNEVVFSLPDMNAMYVGYDNVVELGFTKKAIRNITIDYDNCDTIRQHPTNPSQWIIRPATADSLTLTVRNKKGKVIGQKKYVVLSPPEPDLHLNTGDAQDVIRTVPTSLIVKYDPSVPLHTVFMIRSWEVSIGDQTFSGRTGNFTKEVGDYLRSKGSGTMIINVTYMGPDGEKFLKELFEFDIR